MRVRLLYMRPKGEKRTRTKEKNEQKRSHSPSKTLRFTFLACRLWIYTKTMHRMYVLTVLPNCRLLLLFAAPVSPPPTTQTARTTHPGPHPTITTRLAPSGSGPAPCPRREGRRAAARRRRPFSSAPPARRAPARGRRGSRGTAFWFVWAFVVEGVCCVIGAGWVGGRCMHARICMCMCCARAYLHLRGALPVHDPKLRHGGPARVSGYEYSCQRRQRWVCTKSDTHSAISAILSYRR